MASHEGSRKRLKISRTESKPSSLAMASSSKVAPSEDCKIAGGGGCNHQQVLKGVQSDIDAMRQIVTCKVCHRLLYEPYSLACGHTYCYSCLSQWLVDSRKKTCPDCRAVVTQQPTPSYLIRELVLVFVSRNELLPDGETSEEHDKYVKEEAELVAKDRANTDERAGGLFKGCFKRGHHGHTGAIHDPGDGVDRCPQCHWELEDGFCDRCGEQFIHEDHLGFSDYDDESDDTDDELDHELDLEDAAAVFGADGQDDYLDILENRSTSDEDALRQAVHHSRRDMQPPARHTHSRRDRSPRGFGHARVTVNIHSSDDEDESEDDDGHEMAGFVVDDDNVEFENSDDGEETDVPYVAQGRSDAPRRAPIVVVSDDEHYATASAGATSESEEDTEDEGPIVRGSQRRKRERPAGRLQQGRRTILSDEESSGDDEDGGESAVENNGGFSPLDSSAAGDAMSYHSEYDSDGVSTIHPLDDEDRLQGQLYHDEDNDEDDDSEESESDDGWGPISPVLDNCERNTNASSGPQYRHSETPTNLRQPPSTLGHRLDNLVGHSNRHTDALSRSSMRDFSSTATGHEYQSDYPYEEYSTLPAAAGPSSNSHRRAFPRYTSQSHGNVATSRPRGFFRPQPATAHLPTHPFQLGDTLNSVNNRTASLTRNYNQRNQQGRSNPVHRTGSTASSRGSRAGGVEVQEFTSSASSSTLRPGLASQRKRLLSVSSDDSVDHVQSGYEC